MGSLRERKQQRVRETIVEAALALFAERGFDNVTVADIAERAEVGRTTFFRYFGDKQEVVFADDETPAMAFAIEPPGPVGDSLPAALAYARMIVVSYVDRITERPECFVLHETLVEQHSELLARGLMKQRRLVAMLAERLAAAGADRPIAVLAAELGLACYYAGREVVGNDPIRLSKAVDTAFARLIDSLPPTAAAPAAHPAAGEPTERPR